MTTDIVPGASRSVRWLTVVAGLLAVTAFSSSPAAASGLAERLAPLAGHGIEFDEDESTVDDEQSALVIEHLHVMEDYPADRLVLHGYAVDTERDAAALALRRARAVKRQLQLLGMDEHRIDTAASVIEHARPGPSPCEQAPCPSLRYWVEFIHLGLRH